MRYCLFCREAFADDPAKCPYCDGELVDRLPEPDEDDADRDADEDSLKHGEGQTEEGEGEPLVEVAVVDKEEDLRAAVDVFKEHGMNFEIEEVNPDEIKVISGREWRLLVPADEAESAFVRLVHQAPFIFPRHMREHFKSAPVADEGEVPPAAETAAKIPAMLEEKPPVSSIDLTRAIAEGLALRGSRSVVRAKLALAMHGVQVAPLLAGIVAEAISAGGEGAEALIFNSLEVLEAIGYDDAIEKIEPLYDSPTPQVRSRAAYAAGRLGDPGSVGGLLDLLADEDEDVRYEASEAIWRLTGLDFEYDPYKPIEEERRHVEDLRKQCQSRFDHDDVLNRTTMASLQEMAALADEKERQSEE